MTTQVFGAISSSTSSFWVLQHAVNSNSQFPAVAKKLVDNFYADNLSDSFETEEEAILFSKQAVKSLASGGFRLTAFASSSRRLLASIPASERSNKSLNLDFDKLPIEYLLGLVWVCDVDCYRIRIRPMEMVTSKRQMLSAMSRTFDPLGILLPVITQAKILFQATWRTTQERVPAQKSGSRLKH
jgi:hypothetical protein